MFARVHGPRNPELVKNGPPGADATPDQLDQWSRPFTRVPERARIPQYDAVTLSETYW